MKRNILPLIAGMLITWSAAAQDGPPDPPKTPATKKPSGNTGMPDTKKQRAKDQRKTPPKKHPIIPEKRPTTIGPASPPGKAPKLTDRQIETLEAYHRCMKAGESGGKEAVIASARRANAERGLIGSPEKLGHENCIADAYGLERFPDLSVIKRAAADGLLVSLAEYAEDVDARKVRERSLPPERRPLVHLYIGPDVPSERHLTRPWVRDYIEDLRDALDEHLREMPKYGGYRITSATIRISSPVRSIRDQQTIVENRGLNSNGSIADCRIPGLCSSHTTGFAIDISTVDMPRGLYRWFADRFESDRKAGRAFAIFEKFGNHFHIIVVPPIDYLGDASARQSAEKKRESGMNAEKDAGPATGPQPVDPPSPEVPVR